MEHTLPADTGDILERHSLRHRESLRTWAGHGTGAICNGCGQPVQSNQIEYEVELPEGSTSSKLNFHFDCYRAWTGRGPR